MLAMQPIVASVVQLWSTPVLCISTDAVGSFGPRGSGSHDPWVDNCFSGWARNVKGVGFTAFHRARHLFHLVEANQCERQSAIVSLDYGPILSSTKGQESQHRW